MQDIQAQEAGIISRREAVKATGYDVAEIERENAADAKRAGDWASLLAPAKVRRSEHGRHRRRCATPARLPTRAAPAHNRRRKPMGYWDTICTRPQVLRSAWRT